MAIYRLEQDLRRIHDEEQSKELARIAKSKEQPAIMFEKKTVEIAQPTSGKT